MKNYLEVIYSEKRTPRTQYPAKLCAYLYNRFTLKKQQKFLDLGCGRGEFLNEFLKLGLETYGIDQFNYGLTTNKQLNIKCADLQNEKLPYNDNTFDVIFSKSVIEHFYYPELLLKEAFRILKPEGKIIIMTPDWESVYKTFYEDYTHRTPFTKTSLADCLNIHSFESIKVEKFRQLPFLWKLPFLKFISLFFALFYFLSNKNKLIRFSKEVMLLAYARKPKEGQ